MEPPRSVKIPQALITGVTPNLSNTDPPRGPGTFGSSAN
jgi:hypothetical protein